MLHDQSFSNMATASGGESTGNRVPYFISRPLAILLSLSLALAGVALPLPSAQANPIGEQVIAGQALFERSPDLLNLTITQGSDRVVINWADFSIGLGELTQFNQPGANSAALNRVMHGLTSRIDGSLLANGQIYLINPNGIIVGPTGRIDTGSFIGSTLDVSDDAFMAGGDLTFAGPSQASVVNFGTINAIGGDIFLIGRHVENHGLLNAPSGTVGLAAGEEVLLRAAGEERLFVQPTAGSGGGGDGVTNTGTIQAATAELKAHGNMYALAINNTGTVRATGVQKKGGRVFLRAPGGVIDSSGTIEAKDGSGGGGMVSVDGGPGGTVNISGKVDAVGDDGAGGEIHITAETVNILDGAELNASGVFGGGSILVGGGLQGQDPQIENAVNTFVDYGAIIRADSYQSGDGGFVVLWADGTGEYHGQISAQAFGATGDGGFVETSGKEKIIIDAQVSTRSANGKFGSLLLDPGSVTIYHSLIGSNEDDSYISDQWIIDMLVDNSLIVTTTDSLNELPQIITLENDVDIFWSENTDLTLEGVEGIDLTAGAKIRSLGEGSIELYAMSGSILVGATSEVSTGGGHIWMEAGGAVVLGDGSLLSTSGVGQIDVIASGGASRQSGLLVGTSAEILTEDGAINLSSATTLELESNSRVQSTGLAGTGHILLEANMDGVDDEDFFTGVTLGPDSLVASASGDITIHGRAGLDGGDGIRFQGAEGAGARLEAPTGDIFLRGIGREVEGIVDIGFGELFLSKTGGRVVFESSFDGYLLETAGTDWSLEFFNGGYADEVYLEHTGSVTFTGTDTEEPTFYSSWGGWSYTAGHTYLNAVITNYNGESGMDFGDVTLIGEFAGLRSSGSDITLGLVDAQGNPLFLDALVPTALGGPELFAGNITLTNPGNLLADMEIHGNVVTIVNDRDIDQNFGWQANELILTAGEHNINLDDSDNWFGDITINSANIVTIFDQDVISQGGAWTANFVNLNAADGGADILLENPTNAIGSFNLSAFNASIVNDLAILQHSPWSVTGTLELNSQGHDIILDNVLNVISNPITIQTESGAVPVVNLTIAQAGAITQANAWHSTGKTIFNAAGGTANITLNLSENSFGDLTLIGNEVSLFDSTEITDNDAAAEAWNTGNITLITVGSNDIILDNAENVMGVITLFANPDQLTIFEDDDINQSNPWSAGSATFVSTGSIFLDEAQPGESYNDFGNLAITAGGELYLWEGGEITDSEDAPWLITGDVWLRTEGPQSQTFDITLNNPLNQFGKISLGNIMPNLTIFATGDIEQGNVWQVTGDTTLVATGNLILNYIPEQGSTQNRFGDLYLSGQTLDLLEEDDITAGGAWNIPGLVRLGRSPIDITPTAWNVDLGHDANILGDIALDYEVRELTIYETGDITQQGPWFANGVNLKSIGGSIYLDNAENVFGDIFLDGPAVELSITENDHINQGNAWTTAGITSLIADGGEPYSIFLANFANDLGDLSLKASYVEVWETGSITDADSPATGWETGETILITDSGDIILDNPGNVMGDITIEGTPGNLTIYEDDDITQGSNWMAGRTRLASTGHVDLSYFVENESYNIFGDLTISALSLTLREGGDITDADDPGDQWDISGLVTLNPSDDETTYAITLDNPLNELGDIALPVSLSSLTIFENSEITQSGPWVNTVLGTTTLNAGTHAITLLNAGNSLGALTINAGQLDLTEADDITQSGAWIVTGPVTLNAGTNSIYLTHEGNELGDLALTALNLTLTENHDISQYAVLTATGDVILRTLGGYDVRLGDFANNFGTVGITGANVSLREANEITQGTTAWNTTGSTVLNANDGLSAITLMNAANQFGALAVNASTLDLTDITAITQSDAWDISGNVTLTTVGNAVTLDNPDNDLGDFAVYGATTLTLVENAHITQQAGAILTIAGPVILDAGDDDITFGNASSSFGNFTVTGDTVSITENGAITQGGAWDTGATTLVAIDNVVTLLNEANSFGDLTITANSVHLVENSEITDGAAWTVSGAVTLNSLNNPITLNNPGNVLGAFNPLGATSLTLFENDNITQPTAWTIAGPVVLNAGLNSIILDSFINQLGDLALTAGSASIRESEDITQGGAWNVPGLVTLNAGTNDVILENAENILGDIALTAANLRLAENHGITQSGAWNLVTAVLSSEAHAITLQNILNSFGALTITAGELALTDNSEITQDGAWNVNGPVTLDALGNNVTLDHEGNVLGAITLANVANLTLTENDAITQGSAWTLGTTVLNSGAHAIQLEDLANIFGDLTITSGELRLTDSSAITQGGAWTTGAATLVSPGQDITLTHADNVLGDLALTAAQIFLTENDAITDGAAWTTGNITLNSTENFIRLDNEDNVFGVVSITGPVPDLYLAAAADIQQAEAWTVSGNTTFWAPDHVVTMTQAANTFGDLQVFAASVQLVENDHITQHEESSSFVSGEASFSTPTEFDITLANPDNFFGSLVLVTDNATIRQSGDMSITQATILELLQIRAGGNIGQTGPINVNTLTAQADNGDLILNHLSNKILFLGEIAALGDIDIFEDPGLNIGGAVFSANGSVKIGSYGGNLTLGPNGYVSAPSSGSQIILYTDQLFLNQSTIPNPLANGPGGFWLIYVGAASGSQLGNLNPNFTQFSVQFPNLPAFGGNGFLVAANAPTVPLPPGSPGLIELASPILQTGPLISQNPINDFSNVGSGLYVQNQEPQSGQQPYEERYEGEETPGNPTGTGGNTGSQVKDVEPGDGVTEFGSDGTKGIPTGNAPPELLDNLNNLNELTDAL